MVEALVLIRHDILPLSLSLIQTLRTLENAPSLKDKVDREDSKANKVRLRVQQINCSKVVDNYYVQFPDGVFVIHQRKGRGGGGGRGLWQEEDEDDLKELEERLNSAKLPDHALKVAQKELKVMSIYKFTYAS